MTSPQRIKASRRKGFNLQHHSLSLNGCAAILVAREGPFGNPFSAEAARNYKLPDPQRTAVENFEDWLTGRPWDWRALSPDRLDLQLLEDRRQHILAHLPALRGFNLACWCNPDCPCHADVLLRLANSPKCAEVSP